jgi:hypothetical protein
MYQPENFITNANQTNDEPGKATTAQLCWTFLIYSTTVVWLVRVSGHPRRHFRGGTGPSHGFPYVVEVEHDGPAILGQPPGIQVAPSKNVMLCVLTGGLRPRHFADEYAHEPLAVSLVNLTMPKAQDVLGHEMYEMHRNGRLSRREICSQYRWDES